MEKVIKRFMSRIDVSESGCWNWTASCNRYGYGWFYYDKKQRVASRASWELHNGKIPDGICVCHKCDNPKCVNPDHLFLGTKRDNSLDMAAKGRGGKGIPNPPIGEKSPNAKLTSVDVLRIGELSGTGISERDISNMFPVSCIQIHRIIKRERWKHI